MTNLPTLEPPSIPVLTIEPLGKQHHRAAFSCTQPDLDTFLREHALQDQERKLSRTFVLTPASAHSDIFAYYTLAPYMLTYDTLPAALRKRLPKHVPLPATLLGRLAVATAHQSQGLGTTALLTAMRDVLRSTRILPSLGLVVDAKSDWLVAYYSTRGFVRLEDRPRHLIAPISRIHALFPADAAYVPTTIDILGQIASTNG
jgi:predicted GNAT family N-acyltransferase